MNREDELFFAASLDHNISVIDLHQYEAIEEALDALEHELFVLSKYENYCRIVYGIGKGILAEHVQKVLENHPLIKAWKPEETGGSAIIIF